MGKPEEAPGKAAAAPPPPAPPAAPPATAEASSGGTKDLERLFQIRLQVTEKEEAGVEDQEKEEEEQQQPPEQQPATGEDDDEDEADGSPTPSSSSDDDDDDDVDEALLRALGALTAAPPPPLPLTKRLLPSLDLQGVARYLSSDACRRVVFMIGAGASTSAGIPDFRSPGTGLYSNLASLGLPHPEAVFELDFFRANPYPFYTLARSLMPRPAFRAGAGAQRWRPPSSPRPTPTHHFFELVRRKSKLLRVFSQNIDSLEHEAGLEDDHVVAAHGNFRRAHCVECGRDHDRAVVERAVFGGGGDEEQEEEEETTARPCAGKKIAVPRCRDARCGGLVKPSIVFFGEGLPRAFFDRRREDMPQADLLVVIGSSLVVHPFAGLLHDVAPHVPRLLINRERVGEARRGGGGARGFVFDGQAPGGGRDVLYKGDADAGVRELARLCGWGDELEALVEAAESGGGGGGGST